MKKIVFVLLAVLVVVSCSKEESGTLPTDGQYIAYTEFADEHNSIRNTFVITIENGMCTDFVLYNGAERFNYYRPADISTKGSYPTYSYRINDFTVQAHFTDLENFTANLSGVLCTHREMDYGLIGETYSTIAMEATDVHFKLNNTPADANADGVLDSKQ